MLGFKSSTSALRILLIVIIFALVLTGCNSQASQEQKPEAVPTQVLHPASNTTIATSTEPLGSFTVNELGVSNIVDVDFVEAKIGDPNWVIVDGRDKKEYEKGHIPGAVNYPNSIVKTLKHPMDGRVVPVDRLAQLLGEVGISNDKKVIIYGAANDYHVLAEMAPLYVGLPEWDYLNGGYEAWVKANKKVEAGPIVPAKTTFTPKVLNENFYISTPQMAKIVADKDPRYFIMDTRSKDEYNGIGFGGTRAGRIPGALSYPVNDLMDKETGKLKVDKFAEIFKDVPKDKTIILYCHRGCRTAFNFLALRSLGYQDIRMYEDAFVVWSNWFELPVEEEHYLNLRGDISKTVERANILWEESEHGSSGGK